MEIRKVMSFVSNINKKSKQIRENLTLRSSLNNRLGDKFIILFAYQQ